MWIVQLPNVGREADHVASFIDQQINAHGRKPGDILVLAQRRSIGNQFMQRSKREEFPQNRIIRRAS
jgi:hypothetical protein